MSSMALPPDMSGMGGAPAGPPPGGDPSGGGLPPDLMALLAGGAGGGDPAAGAPNSITDGQHGGGQDALTLALDALQDAIDAEADQEDIQVMLQCQTKLQQILAKNQAEADKAMGGGASPAAMRKMAGSL